MSDTVTFDGAPPAGTINLGIGQPSADLLPVDLVKQASDAFFDQAQPIELNYGSNHGDERFLNTLADYLSEGYGKTAAADELFVTGGNSQALDFVSGVFTRPGDTVFVEEPSYFLAFQIFRDHGLNIVGIPMDEDGLDIDYLAAMLRKHKPAFLYTIPSYHNPGGQCLSAERRLQLIELSQQHGFLIVADEVYQLLSYSEAPPAAFGSMLDSDTVLSLGSFSKILAPGMRLGWIQTSAPLRKRLLSSGFVNSGGSINHYTSHIVRMAIELGLQDAHVEKLRQSYRTRANAMDDALHTHFDDIASWRRPEGGYFFWIRIADDVDTVTFRDGARERETGFQPGSVFSSSDGLRNFLRLSFAHYDENNISEGIARLRPVFG